MGTIDHDLTAIFEAERKDAQEPLGLAEVVARRAGRRRRTALAGTAAAGLALAGLAATLGVSIAQNPQPAASAPGDIVVSLATDYVGSATTLSLTHYCGEAPPAPAPITGDFSLTSQVPSLADNLTTDVTANGGGYGAVRTRDVLSLAARHDGHGKVRVGWLFVQNGVVVGYIQDGPWVGNFATGFNAWSSSKPMSLDSWTLEAASCDPGSPIVGLQYGDTWSLPAGDYEAYPIVAVDTTNQFDALATLAAAGISPSPISGVTLPGSWDCRYSTERSGRTPINCVEPSIYDPGTNRASVTVPPEFQSPAIHETLVGNPLPYSRTGALPEQPTTDWGIGSDSPGFDYCTDPQWSDAGVQVSDATDDEVFAHMTADLGGLSARSEIDVDASILADQRYDGTYAGLANFDFWVVAEPYNGGWYPVAHGVASVNGGGQLTLDRYVGPTPVRLHVDQVTWCGQPPASDVPLMGALLGRATWPAGEWASHEATFGADISPTLTAPVDYYVIPGLNY